MRRSTLFIALTCLAVVAVGQTSKPKTSQKKPAGQKPPATTGGGLQHLIPGVGGAVPPRKKPPVPTFPNPTIPFVGPLPGIGPAPVVVPGQGNNLPSFPGMQLRAVSPLLYGVNVMWGDNGGTANWDKDNGAKARRLGQLIKDVGATNARIVIRWGDVERVRGKYDWRATDRFVNHVADLGITPICMVSGSPDWAVDRSPAVLQVFAEKGVPNLASLRAPDPKYYADLGRFAYACALRYKDKIRHWEFWSEPAGRGMPFVVKNAAGSPTDIGFEGDPKLYANLLRVFSSNVKRADPTARVAVGGLQVHTTEFLTVLYASGAKPYFDAVALHPSTERDVIAFPWIDQVRAVMEKNGDAGKNLWLTEWGWATAPGRPDGITELHQARLIRESLAGMRDRPFITQASYHALNDWRTDEARPITLVSTGLCTYNLMPKPGYYAFKEAATGGNPAMAAAAFKKVGLVGGLPTAEEGGVRGSAVNVLVNAAKPGEPVPPVWQDYSQGYEPGGTEFVRTMGPRLKAVGAKLVRFDPFPNPDAVSRSGVVVEAGDTTGRADPPAPQYETDWQYADAMVEMLAQAGAKPMMNFATMPSALSAPTGNTRLPRDAAQWSRFVQSVVTRYNGEQKRGIVYWELSNEPDTGPFSVSEWLRFYEVFAKAVTTADPQVKVGGPSVSAYSDEWLKALVDYCARNSVPLHFLSWHAYGQPPAEYARQVAEMRAHLQNYPALKDTELFVDEWNASARASEENDSLVGATYALSVVEQMMNAAPARALFFQVKEGIDVRNRERRFNGRWGMLTHDNKPKPVYNAFRLLSKLEGLRLPAGSEDSDIHALASRDKSSVTVLVWSDPVRSEGERGRGGEGASSRPDTPIHVRVKGLPWTGATAGKQWVVDRQHGNGYTDPARGELEQPVSFAAPSGDIEIPVVLPTYGIVCVELTPTAAPKVELNLDTPRYVVYSGSPLSLTATLKNASTAAQTVSIRLSSSSSSLISAAQSKSKPFSLAPGEARSFRYLLRTTPDLPEGQQFFHVTAGPASASMAVKFVPPVAAKLETARVDVPRPNALPDSVSGAARVRVSLENRAETALQVGVSAGRAAESVTIPARRATSLPISIAPPSSLPGNYRVPVKVSVSGRPVSSVEALVGVPVLCRYAKRTPRINGDLNEWADAFPIPLDAQPNTREKPWTGPADLSAQALTMWDEKNLYIALSVGDNVHYQPYTAEEMRRGDSVRIAIDTRRAGRTDQQGFDANVYEIGIAGLSGGPVVYCFSGGILSPNRIFGAEAAVRREGARTIYEAAIPWSDLSPLKPQNGAIAGLSLVVNDNDGQGRGYIEWAGGLADVKRPGRFIGLRLVKE